ncbi:serine/threonine-protein kinase [Euzebya pacifica]|uniref:serine/threonine-protein kinase n=1 Tax=Euzebya pacifica TaxID=1608957 RepID=UPI0030FC4199
MEGTSRRPGHVPGVPGVSGLVEIGRGGFGVVYRGHQEVYDRDVAVKVITATMDAEMADGLAREIRAMGRMSGHPNVLQVYVAGTTDDSRPYLVTPWATGGSLQNRIDTRPQSPDEVRRWAIPVARAVDHIHRAGMLHRDLKPDNILFGAIDTPLVADFGIAKLADGTRTATGKSATTVHYAAPEVIEGRGASPASDVYALGATMYHALTGSEPFAAHGEQHLLALMRRVLEEPPDVPKLMASCSDQALGRLVLTCLAKEPAGRPATAGAIADTLEGRPVGRVSGPHPAVAHEHASGSKSWSIPHITFAPTSQHTSFPGSATSSAPLGGETTPPTSVRTTDLSRWLVGVAGVLGVVILGVVAMTMRTQTAADLSAPTGFEVGGNIVNEGSSMPPNEEGGTAVRSDGQASDPSVAPLDASDLFPGADLEVAVLVPVPASFVQLNSECCGSGHGYSASVDGVAVGMPADEGVPYLISSLCDRGWTVSHNTSTNYRAYRIKDGQWWEASVSAYPVAEQRQPRGVPVEYSDGDAYLALLLRHTDPYTVTSSSICENADPLDVLESGAMPVVLESVDLSIVPADWGVAGDTMYVSAPEGLEIPDEVAEAIVLPPDAADVDWTGSSADPPTWSVTWEVPDGDGDAILDVYAEVFGKTPFYVGETGAVSATLAENAQGVWRLTINVIRPLASVVLVDARIEVRR